MNTKSTYTFSVEHDRPCTTGPLPPKGPWGSTWFIVRIAAVLVTVAEVVAALLTR